MFEFTLCDGANYFCASYGTHLIEHIPHNAPVHIRYLAG